MSSDIEQARLALAAKGAAERDLARIGACPPWRHAAFGAVEAALVATPAFPVVLRFAILTVAMAGLVLIVQSDRKRLGVFINGYRRGKTRLVALPMAVALLAIYGASCYFGLDRHMPAVSLALAALTFVGGYIGSTLWQRVFVRELGA